MAKDHNEIVTIELTPEGAMRLNNQIVSGMEHKDYPPYNWKHLDLGFELPPGWPADKDARPTLAQLIVFAQKLGMQIEINDLNMVPRSND